MNAHDGRSTAEPVEPPGPAGPSAHRARRRRLGGRHRLAGEHRLVALELVRLEQPHVGGDEFPDVQFDDVAGYELAHVELLPRTVAPHDHFVADIRVERRNRLLRPVLVHEPEPDAQRDDRGDDATVGAVAGRRRHRGRREEEDEQRVTQLPHQHPERGDPPGGEHVRPVLP